MGMGAFTFSLLTNFYKTFDNGIILVVILSMIPIFLLGMTGIADEAFAQSQVTPNNDTSISASILEIGINNELIIIIANKTTSLLLSTI